MARFRLRNAFAPEPAGNGVIVDDVICSQPTFRVVTAILEHHHAPCLGFAVEEVAHLNVWKSRLAELGLPVGSWLRDLKQAVMEGRPADHLLRVPTGHGADAVREMPLSALNGLLTVTPGQKIAYLTDIADTAANRAAAVSLVRNADMLFIESAFAQADAALAAQRSHLTTAAAGAIAREARARRVEPFHFSPRYAGDEARRQLGRKPWGDLPASLQERGGRDTRPSRTNGISSHRTQFLPRRWLDDEGSASTMTPCRQACNMASG
jgi:ribonuclease Z